MVVGVYKLSEELEESVNVPRLVSGFQTLSSSLVQRNLESCKKFQ